MANEQKDPYEPNWELAPPVTKQWLECWHAVDKDEYGWFYETKPTRGDEKWGNARNGKAVQNLERWFRGDNWQGSLRKRP